MSVNMSKLPRETGIYLITVKIGNFKHVYVGQSENMRYRQSKHLYDSIHRPKNSTIYPLFKGNEATFWKGDDLGLHLIGEYKGDRSPKVIRITDTNNGEVFLFKSKREAGRYFEAGHSSFSHSLLTGGLWKNKYKIELIDK